MYYVYSYRDPKEKLPFYIGKGTGNRKIAHLRETKENTENYLKWCKIQSIRNRGELPVIEIIFKTEDEQEAYEYEKALIKKYGRKEFDEGGILTNRCEDGRPPTYSAKLPRSKEYLDNMSKAKQGSKNPMYNKTPWNYGLPMSSASKQKISDKNSGRKYTSEEHATRNKTRGKVYEVTSPDGETFVVENLKQWCLERNFNYSMFGEAMRGYNGKTNYKGWTGHVVGTVASAGA